MKLTENGNCSICGRCLEKCRCNISSNDGSTIKPLILVAALLFIIYFGATI